MRHAIFEKSILIAILVSVICVEIVESRTWERTSSLGEVDSGQTVINEIRAEATRPNNDSVGRPLPLASHWIPLSRYAGIPPDIQLDMIEAGHHILLALPSDADEDAIRRAAGKGLPISLVYTQWEYRLSQEPYISIDADNGVFTGDKSAESINPNVISCDGGVLQSVSPFGPQEQVDLWREVGEDWAKDNALAAMQEWYPNPPLVVFVSNNEHSKLSWPDVMNSKRYIEMYIDEGKEDGMDNVTKEDFRRKVVGDGWIERYGALIRGFRNGLGKQQWKDSSIFIGYSAFGPRHFNRWDGWLRYSLASTYEDAESTQNDSIPRIDPSPLVWEGATVPFYVSDWSACRDYILWSPQIEAMNWVFMLEEAYQFNPDFWFETSVWDGGIKQRAFYEQKGQTYTPERYAGMIQFGMWLLRPRVVREFRYVPGGDTNESLPYFYALCEAVDRVYEDETLKSFWREGKLVANPARKHFYQSTILEGYTDEEIEQRYGVGRWFLLDTDVNPKLIALNQEIPVFSLALVKGEAPYRQWLIYAHSPLRERSGVKITIPDYKPIIVNVSVGGSFYLVDEGGTTLPDSATVLYMSFDEQPMGNIVKDDSGSGNNGIIVGEGVSWTNVGKLGGALRLDGTSRVEIPHSDSLNLDKEITLEIWFRTEVPQKERFLIYKEHIGDGRDYEWGLLLTTDSTRTSSYVVDPENNVKTAEIFGEFADGGWHFLAGTYDGEVLKLYVDGQLVTVDWSASIRTSPGSVIIGAWNDFFIGTLDEARILNVALSEAEIRSDYENGYGIIPQIGISRVSVEARQNVGIGSSFVANINMGSVGGSSDFDLARFQMDVYFDPGVLEAMNVGEGSVLSDSGSTLWFAPTIDNTDGIITGISCAKTSPGGTSRSGTLATVTFKAVGAGQSNISMGNVKLSDSSGESAMVTLSYAIVTVTEFPPWDINRDGQTDILDLVIVAQHFGQQITAPMDPNPDLNNDGEINVLDLVILGRHFGETNNPAAPSADIWSLDAEYLPLIIGIYNAISDMTVSDPDFAATRDILSRLIHNAKVNRTEVFQNYPNPFNPETWIPYQLAKDSKVAISIYDVNGRLIRAMDLGYMAAGAYATKDAAAYWDGRNEAGEHVASGLYFYTIQAGQYTATRKMAVRR